MSTEMPAYSRAPAWEIRWQSSDLPAFETPPLAALSEAEDNPTAATAAATVTVISESGGLSAGETAGIIVGVLALVLIAIGAAFFLWKRRKDGKTGDKNAAAAQPVQQPYVPPGGVHEADGTANMSLSVGQTYYPPMPAAQELGSSEHPVAELPENNWVPACNKEAMLR